MISEMAYEESFGIIPLRHSKDKWSVFIILHKHGNHWGFPKGKADKGETSLESAKRELQEETGLKVEKFIREEPFEEEYSFYRGKESIRKKVLYFPAIISGALFLQPEEIRDGKWMPLEEAKGLLTFQEPKNICTKLQEILKNF